MTSITGRNAAGHGRLKIKLKREDVDMGHGHQANETFLTHPT